MIRWLPLTCERNHYSLRAEFLNLILIYGGVKVTPWRVIFSNPAGHWQRCKPLSMRRVEIQTRLKSVVFAKK